MNAASPLVAPGVGARALVEVVPMRRRHLRSVLRIERAAPHRGWSAGLYLGELRRPEDRRYVVARRGAAVVGFAGLMQVLEDAHVTTIAVDPAVQGQRIGTRLMLALAEQARAWGCDNLTLEVRPSNAAAIALYRRFGLAPAGVRKGYYADLGEDALVMWGHEVQSPAFADRLAAIAATLDLPSGPPPAEGTTP